MSFADTRCIRPNPSLAGMSGVRGNPLDVFERLSIAEHYDFERVNPTELHMCIPGLWCNHDVSLTWDLSAEIIQLFLTFEGRIPGGRSDDICRLMSLLNERLSAGHFDYWEKNAALVYRNSMSLRGGAELKTEQAMTLLAHAIDAAERGFPACQYVVWAGKSPEEALTTALIDLAAQS